MCLVALVLLSAGADAAFLSSLAFRNMQHQSDYTEAKNVCMSINQPCSRRLQNEEDDDSNKFLAKQLNLQAMPKGFKGKIVPTALLVTRSKTAHLDKKSTAFRRKEHEWSESMMPMFDFVSELREKFDRNSDNEDLPLFNAVVLPQVPTAKHFMESASFDGDVLDALLESSGAKGGTEKLFCEEIKKEPMVCFNRMVHYRHGSKVHLLKQKKHLVSAKAAVALRKHMKYELAANPSVKTLEGRKHDFEQGRNAVLVVRKDHQGWVNWLEVASKTKEFLAKKCWNLQVHDTQSSVQDSAQIMKDADLVLANHGVHNEHMIWMPRQSAFIEDKNCKCSTYSHEDLAKQENLRYASTYSANEDRAQCALEKQGLGICADDKPRVVNFEVEIQPTLESMIKTLEFEHRDEANNIISHPCKPLAAV